MLGRLGLLRNGLAARSSNVWVMPRRDVTINADEIRNNFILDYEGKKMIVVSYHAAMMGRRPTSLHIEMKDMTSGKVYPVRFNPTDRVERVIVDHVDYQFLYIEGSIAYAMHPETFEQIEFDSGLLGKAAPYVLPDSTIDIGYYNGQIFTITTPEFVTVQVAEVPFHDSNMNTNEYKNVVLANGRTIRVPQFVQKGDKIRVKVADESFSQREQD